MNMNVVVLQGNLVADPEFVGQDGSVARFTIAVNTGFGENQETHYIDCVAFGKQVETIRNHVAKGKQIVVKGRLTQNRWESKDDEGNTRTRSKIEVRLDNFEGFSFVSGGREQQTEAAAEGGGDRLY